jgi:hypothetical protein
MKNLELECLECGEKITLELGDEEYEHYELNGSLIEGSEAYHELFDGAGWVLQQSPFCDLCKYDHSECYLED